MTNRGGLRASHAALMLRYGEALHTLTAPVPVSWIALLDNAAAAQGIARSDLIRALVEAWLHEQALIPRPPEQQRPNQE